MSSKFKRVWRNNENLEATLNMETRLPAISVIIPTFNRAESLSATLESLAAQTLPRRRYEVVVVDDGSKDATPKVCGDFADGFDISPH
jgi:glycosyltransferase involved in cell wall biosynthesis